VDPQNIFQVILQQAYSTDVDWWALGVILYELLHGITPFYAESVEEVFSNICKGEVEFLEEEDLDEGEEALDEDCRYLILQLLNVNYIHFNLKIISNLKNKNLKIINFDFWSKCQFLAKF